MEITKISESFVKPSSPTPSNLKTYKISLLDQLLSFERDNPVILYYSSQNFPFGVEKPISENFISKRSQLLKQSLSKSLTKYYPLAGTIKDSFSVDCNDVGIHYVEARANISLAEYFSLDYIKLMNSTLPVEFDAREPPAPGSYIAKMQEITFSCGSIAISALFRHMVMDGVAIVSFIKAWAATAICDDARIEMFTPNFDGPILYPQYNAFPMEASVSAFENNFSKKGKLCLTRFLFDDSHLARLQAYTASSTVKNPTRTEAVTSILCKCISDVQKTRTGIDRPTAFTQLVNLRARAIPRMPDSSFGSFLWMAPCLFFSEELKLSNIVIKMRESIRKIDADFLKIIKKGGFFKLYEKMSEITKMFENPTLSKGVNYILFDSLCNMGSNELDFGFGKPIWIIVDDPPPNSYTESTDIVLLMDWTTGNGVEAWVYMDEEDLLLLEKHEELLAYASLNPNPFNSLLISHL